LPRALEQESLQRLGLERPELLLARVRLADRLHLRERILFNQFSVEQPAPKFLDYLQITVVRRRLERPELALGLRGGEVQCRRSRRVNLVDRHVGNPYLDTILNTARNPIRVPPCRPLLVDPLRQRLVHRQHRLCLRLTPKLHRQEVRRPSRLRAHALALACARVVNHNPPLRSPLRRRIRTIDVYDFIFAFFYKVRDTFLVLPVCKLHPTSVHETPSSLISLLFHQPRRRGKVGGLVSTESEFITFSEAVQLKLLTDYKVIVLAIDAKHVSARIQELLKDDNNQLNVDDAARIIGCWKALSKHGMASDLRLDPEPMKRAVAFCQVIERQSGATKHKVSSKQMAAMFQAVVDAYQAQEDSDVSLRCEADHVDGSMNAKEKERKLTWLKAEPPENTCRILSNVRCLSEGVDVPALDAVLFLSPRNSQVDVVQSVGRVMRRTADGKKQLGYVILPVVIPEGMEPHEALSDNKVYKVVWEVLQALRSHDDRFDAMINKLDLIGRDTRKMEVIAITDKIQRKAHRSDGDGPGLGYAKVAKSTFSIGSAKSTPDPVQRELQFNVGEIERALYAKIVQKCGNRRHWEEWANDIAKIAQTHITRISQIVSDPKNTQEVAAFTAFADELRDDLNDSITNAEVIEMLAQHLITKPVFEALFKDYSFASNNPVSQAMQNVLDLLQAHRLDKEADTLEKFYASVAMRAEGIDKAEGKQKIVVELYDKFFRNAFPKLTERLGIVYTPVEVVDFIIHSINDLLQSEFGQTLGSKGVHILDPFTGTGTFITRLLQSGLIKPEELPHKYKHEIHANEIVLLAYYIAAINIEAVYHSLVGGKYEPFEGICLTDTFRLGEEDLISGMLANNSDRRKRQQKLEVRVIMGNPPYSKGQEDANDNNQNVAYPQLDARIRDTYAARCRRWVDQDRPRSSRRLAQAAR
jgi:predicted helicase